MRIRRPSGPVRRLAIAGALLAAVHVTAEAAAPALRVGSKSFTESYLVAEIVAQIAEHTREAKVERALGLGGTGIAYGALANGGVEMYLEYTGTISRAILKDPTVTTVDDLRARLKPLGLTISDPLGFANTYALAVRRETADRLGIRTISDLRGHPGFTAAFDPGFLQRDDGWPGLARHYGLAFADVRGMEHALTYQALSERRVDVIDVFSTDGRLARGDLRVLTDDRHFFPDYAAVLFLRASMPERLPRTWAVLQQRLVGKVDTATMVRLNALVDVDGRTFAQAAATFLGAGAPGAGRDLARDLAKLTIEHLLLVLVSLVAALAVGLPLGLLTTRGRRLAQLQLAGVGVLQTIPALALLAFMIPFFGIGRVPALVALALYALLPIVRNVHAGVSSIDPQLLDMAAVMRLRGWRRLLEIEIPLASVTIMAGIKTAAVSTVGTATLAAFIGGGGYGTLIVTGLALNDVRMILSGAIPAALMALAIHAGFELLDRAVVPIPLRARSSSRV